MSSPEEEKKTSEEEAEEEQSEDLSSSSASSSDSDSERVIIIPTLKHAERERERVRPPVISFARGALEEARRRCTRLLTAIRNDTGSGVDRLAALRQFRTHLVTPAQWDLDKPDLDGLESSGLVEVTIQILNSSTANTETKLECADILTELSGEPHPVCSRIVRLGGIDALLPLLQLDDPQVVCRATAALNNLAIDSAANQTTILRAGVIRAVVRNALRFAPVVERRSPNIHRENAFECCLWMLAQLVDDRCVDDPTALTDDDRLMTLPLLSLVLETSTSTNVIGSAVEALKCLTNHASAVVMREVTEAGAILPRLVELIADASTLGIRQNALRAIGNVVSDDNDAYSALLIRHNLLPALDVLMTHASTLEPDWKRTQLYGDLCWIISNLSMSDAPYLDRVKESQLHERCFAIVGLDTRIDREIVWTIANLLLEPPPTSGRNVDYLVRLRVGPTLVALTRTPELSITRVALESICRLSAEVRSIEHMREAWTSEAAEGIKNRVNLQPANGSDAGGISGGRSAQADCLALIAQLERNLVRQ
jgi:hypothetical protein